MDHKPFGLKGPLHRSGRASRTIGVSKSTLVKLRESGAIQAVRSPGGHWLYDVSSFFLHSKGGANATANQPAAA